MKKIGEKNKQNESVIQETNIQTINVLENEFREKQRGINYQINNLRKCPGTEGHETPVGKMALNIQYKRMKAT